MKKLTIGILSIFLVVLFAYSYLYEQDFLDSAVNSISASSTATNGSEFTSNELRLITESGFTSRFIETAIEITFTGDGSMDGSDVDFYFQVSLDGSTWSTDEYVIVDCPSDEDHDSNVVRHTEVINAVFEKIRLWKVVNNDSANSVDDVNATLAFRY